MKENKEFRVDIEHVGTLYRYNKAEMVNTRY